MSRSRSPFHLALALDGAGWHPGVHTARTDRDALSLGAWRRTVRLAEDAGFDLVTFEDTFGAPPAGPDGRPRPRLDAHTVAAALSTATDHIGLVPTVTVTHTEPYHVAIRTATLDHTTRGRSGWQVRISPGHAESRLTGTRSVPDPGPDGADSPAVLDLLEEAAAVVETVRDTWDSWEDDAVVRDVATGRFLDADRLHRVDAETRWFSVAGPSVVPRPPQGQPVVAALAHGPAAYALAARAADLVLVTPATAAHAAAIVAEVREAERVEGRSGEPLRILADLLVVLGRDEEEALERLRSLDAAAGAGLASDAAVVAGTADQLADRLERLRAAGIQGVRLRPAENAVDLPLVDAALVPELVRRGLRRTGYVGTTLREQLGLTRPENRFVSRTRRPADVVVQPV